MLVKGEEDVRGAWLATVDQTEEVNTSLPSSLQLEELKVIEENYDHLEKHCLLCLLTFPREFCYEEKEYNSLVGWVGLVKMETAEENGEH
ncbi:unnamed protein product [Sphenostylis stenocarpa]|uniref:Uncharacterized protein n=1 Tax=Sphenostylis stenocarpa TaxID=92480 RepID=A0AA86SYP5_9FABA|nr:unnamed protein product [Sphenostylis stenocarpa]